MEPARQGPARPAVGRADRSAPTIDPVGQRFDGDGDQPIVDAVQQVAEARGVPMAQVALAWVLRTRSSPPRSSARKPHHLADAVAALDVTLTDDEIAALEEPYTPRLATGMEVLLTVRRRVKRTDRAAAAALGRVGPRTATCGLRTVLRGYLYVLHNDVSYDFCRWSWGPAPAADLLAPPALVA